MAVAIPLKAQQVLLPLRLLSLFIQSSNKHSSALLCANLSWALRCQGKSDMGPAQVRSLTGGETNRQQTDNEMQARFQQKLREHLLYTRYCLRPGDIV